MEFTQENENRTTIWFSNFTSGYLPEENKNPNSTAYMHVNVQCNIIYNSHDMEVTSVSTDVHMDKEDAHTHTHIYAHIYTHIHTYIPHCTYNALYIIKYDSAIKKEGNVVIYNNVNGLRGCYTKWNNSEKDKYHMVSLICRI